MLCTWLLTLLHCSHSDQSYKQKHNSVIGKAFYCVVRENSLHCLCPFPPHSSANQLSRTTMANVPSSGKRRQASFFFYPRIAVELRIVWPEQSYLAAVVSSSISGHVCGGVVRRWLSRNTEALKANGEILPRCIFEVCTVNYDCCSKGVSVNEFSDVFFSVWGC